MITETHSPAYEPTKRDTLHTTSPSFTSPPFFSEKHTDTSLALQELYLSYNNISVLPPDHSLWSLPALSLLDLANNTISEIPLSVTKLRTLGTLDVTNNQLNSLPGEIGFMPALAKLYIEGELCESNFCLCPPLSPPFLPFFSPLLSPPLSSFLLPCLFRSPNVFPY